MARKPAALRLDLADIITPSAPRKGLAGLPLAVIVGSGATGGSFVGLAGIVVPRFFGRLHMGAIGGVGMSSMVIASGIGPFAFSLSIATSGSYHAILWISIAIPAILALLSITSDNPQRKFERS